MEFSNYFLLEGNKFILLNDGISCNSEQLNLKFLPSEHNIEEIEELSKCFPDILDIYDSKTKEISGQFKGYKELRSITKVIEYRFEDDTYGDIIDLFLVRPEEVWFYVSQIKKGKMTINDVPERLQEEVKKALEY